MGPSTYQSVPFEIYFSGTNKSLILMEEENQQTVNPYRSTKPLIPSIDYFPAVSYNELQDVIVYFDDIDVVHLYIQIPMHLRSLFKAVYVENPRTTNYTVTYVKYEFDDQGLAELIFPASWVQSSVKDDGTVYSIDLSFGLDSSQEFPCGNGQDFYILDEAVSSPLTNYMKFFTNEPTMAICGVSDIPLIKDSKGYFIFQGQPYEDETTVPYGINYDQESSNTLEVITACIYQDQQPPEEPIEEVEIS